MKKIYLPIVITIALTTLSFSQVKECAFKEGEHDYKRGVFTVESWDYASEHREQFIGLGKKCMATLFGQAEETSGTATNQTHFYYVYEGNKRVGVTIVAYKMGKVKDIRSTPL